MGWFGTPIGDSELRTTSERRDWLIREMQAASSGSNDRLVAHSGLVNYRRVWGLYEQYDESDMAVGRFIAVGDIQVRGHEAVWRIDDESVGPVHYDCPQRLLKDAMAFEPVNESARVWRQEVLAHHERRRERNRLVREIEKAHPDGDTRMVVGGKSARLILVRGVRGQTQRAVLYDAGGLYALSARGIDVDATRRLRATPPDAANRVM